MLDSNSCVSWFTYLWIVSATVCIILLNFLKSLAVSDSKVIQNVVLIKASVLTGQSPLFGARIPLRIGRGHISVKMISPYILFTTCLNYNSPVAWYSGYGVKMRVVRIVVCSPLRNSTETHHNFVITKPLVFQKSNKLN